MSPEGIKPFCPHCQADWDRPWHDVCPACGHRFKGLPWWRSLWLVPLLVALPAAAVLASRLPWSTAMRVVMWILFVALLYACALGLCVVIGGHYFNRIE